MKARFAILFALAGCSGGDDDDGVPVCDPPASGAPAWTEAVVPEGEVLTFAWADDALLLDGQTGSWRTTDGGATLDPIGDYHRFVAAPSEPATVYAIGGPSFHAVSHDGGATWEDYSADGEVETVGADPDHVYGSMVDGLGGSGDGGRTWTPLAPPLAQVAMVIADPRVGERIYVVGTNASGDAVLRSDDGGDSWTTLDTQAWVPRPDPRRSDRLWRLVDGAIERSDDAGDSWDALSGGPDDIRAISIDGAGRAVALTGAQQIFTVGADGAWEEAGDSPVVAFRAASADCPDSLAFLGETDLDRVHVTRTLGIAP